jgi:hypothetical protein
MPSSSTCSVKGRVCAMACVHALQQLAAGNGNQAWGGMCTVQNLRHQLNSRLHPCITGDHCPPVTPPCLPPTCDLTALFPPGR